MVATSDRALGGTHTEKSSYALAVLYQRGEDLLVELTAFEALTSGPWRGHASGRSSQELLLCQCAQRLIHHLTAIEQIIYDEATRAERMGALAQVMRAQYRLAVTAVTELAHTGETKRIEARGQAIVAALRACIRAERNLLLPEMERMPQVDFPQLIELVETRFSEIASTLPATLDVRDIAHHQRLPLIVTHCRRLVPGQSFKLIHLFDPRPLRGELGTMCTGQFTWEYATRGAGRWEVRIGRPESVPDLTVPPATTTRLERDRRTSMRKGDSGARVRRHPWRDSDTLSTKLIPGT